MKEEGYAMTKRNIKVRILSLALTCCLVFGMTASTVSAASPTTTSVVSANGITYTISSETEQNGDKIITIATNNSKDKSVLDVSKDTIVKTDYKYAGKSFFGNEKFIQSDKKVEKIDKNLGATSDAVTAQAISYRSKTYIKWPGNAYWYCYGSETNKSYLKIGCSNTYQIRTDNLAYPKPDNCDKYTNAILQSNSCYNEATTADAVTLAVCVGLIILNCALPETVLITLMVAAIGGGGGWLIHKAYDSYTWYCKAGDAYVQIRSYGTQL